MNEKILYISYDGMTDPLGQSQVIPYLQGLSREGYRISILSFEKKTRFRNSGDLIRAMLKGADIDWYPQTFSTRPPYISKIYDARKMKSVAVRLHRKEKFNMVHCRSYQAADAGLLLKKKFRIPYLFDMRGFWVDERVDNGQWNLENPVYRYFYKVYKRKEKKYFSNADHVVSLTQKGKEELILHYGVIGESITVIPCCVDMEHFDYHRISEPDQTAARQKLGIKENDFLISYLGSLGGWYLEKEMLDFFSVLTAKNPSAKFLFITPDPPEKIHAACKQAGVDTEKVIIQYAARKEVPLFLSLSDLNIFFIKDAYSKRASSPTKQGEVMAMGLPLVCNDIGDTGTIVEKTGTGVVVRIFQKEDYEQAVERIPVLLHLSKEKIREAAKEYYDLTGGLDKYKQVYSRILV